MLLGSVSLTPVEVGQIYQTLAAGGFRAPLRAIREVLDASGRPLNRYPLAIESAADATAVYLTTWAMQQVVQQGTAASLKKRLPKDLTVAGKTGTTNGLRDSWFAGFSGDKVLVVWVGRDDNKPTKLTGASGALRIWGDIITTIESRPLPELQPAGVTEVRVDPQNGLLAGRGCGRGMEVPFAVEAVPTATSACGANASSAPQTAGRGRESASGRKKGRTDGGLGEFLQGFFGN
jgi:penicillin-binding protein 1B